MNPDYQSNVQAVGTTATKYIDGAFTSADLEITICLASGSVDCRMSFSSVQAASGTKIGDLSSSGRPFRFVLAMGEDLWMQTDSGTAIVNLLATKKA